MAISCAKKASPSPAVSLVLAISANSASFSSSTGNSCSISKFCCLAKDLSKCVKEYTVYSSCSTGDRDASLPLSLPVMILLNFSVNSPILS